MIVGPSKEMNGKYVIAVDPVLVYLDTCVWIEMFQAYRNKKERIIEKIAGAVGNDEFRLLVSTVNFFELIGTIGDISEHFAPESFQALSYVRQISVHQPPIITEQEVVRYVNRTRDQVKIFDKDHVAINSIAEGFEHRERGNTKWFSEIR